jgi:hypothetical protein
LNAQLAMMRTDTQTYASGPAIDSGDGSAVAVANFDRVETDFRSVETTLFELSRDQQTLDSPTASVTLTKLLDSLTELNDLPGGEVSDQITALRRLSGPHPFVEALSSWEDEASATLRSQRDLP